MISELKQKFNWDEPKFLPKESSLRLWILFLCILVVNIVVIIEAVGVAITLSVMQGYLAIDETKTTWINNVFMLALGMTVPLAIYTSRNYGFKFMFFWGVVLFSFGTLLTAMARSYIEVLVFHVISGIGGGLIFPISLAVIKRAFEGKTQRLALSLYIGLGFGGGFILGTFIGGFYGQNLDWRGIDWLCFYFTLPCLFFILAFMNEGKRYQTDAFDFITYIGFSSFLISTLCLLSQTKAPWNTEGWRSNFTIGCLVVMVISLMVVIIRYYHTKSPLFALSLFKNIDFSFACIAMGFVGMMFFGSNFVMMSLLEQVYLYERLRIGYAIAYFGGAFVVFGALASLLSRKLSPYVITCFGLSLLAISSFMNHSITIMSPPKDLEFLFMVRAAGVGLSLGPLTALALRNVSDDLTGQAAAIATIFRQVGGAFGASAISLIATMREAFHFARFSEMVHKNSPALRDYMVKFTHHIGNAQPTNPKEALKESQGQVLEMITAQANLAAFDDAFFIFGWVFIALSIFVLCLAAFRKSNQNNS